MRAFLRAEGWPEPVLADSGNGFHLLYRVELPADDGGLVKAALEALARRFDTPAVRIDRSVHNPSRIVKVPGTVARKGDHTPDRPHRRSKFLDVPDQPAPVARELLVRLAAEAQASAPPPTDHRPPPNDPPPSATYRSRLKVDHWLTDRGVPFRVKPEPDARGRTVYVLGACPFDDTHADPDACVMQAADGKLSAHCFHNGCTGRGWAAFKAAVGQPDPHHYDPPLRSRTRGRANTRAAADSAAAAGYCPVPPGAPDAPAGNTSRPVVTIDPSGTPVLDTMAAVTDVLVIGGDGFRRADQLVRITGDTITPVLSAPELAGLLNHFAEVVVTDGSSAEFRPLPANYANTWLNHPGQRNRLPGVTLFTRNPVFTTDWRLSPPGYDPASGIYFAGSAVASRAGTPRLDALLADFCFRSPGDRTNYTGVFLTALLMPHFIGSKPAVLFAGNQPGLGKSILAQILAILRDGRASETCTYNPNDEEFEKRLGAVVHRGATTIIIDNAKGKGRSPRIDSACLERSITDAVLSFRLLGHSRDIRAENAHLFCLTANAPDVSRDLVTRSVVVDLFHEGDPTARTFTIPDLEGYALDHRPELLGELVGMVERWKHAGSPRADARSRFNKKGWGPIVGGILAHAGRPDFLANAEAAAAELDDTRREFAELVSILADHPQGLWTATELAALVTQHGLFRTDFKDLSERSVSTRLGILSGRYVGVRFPLSRTRSAVFHRTDARKGSVYRVAVEDAADADAA